MAELTLPAVASRIYVDCKKCEAERYHIVLAHTNSTSAKVECEVCHSKKTYKLPKAGAAKEKKAPTGAAAKRKAASMEAKANAHRDEYNNLMAAAKDEASYNMKLKFTVNQKVKHPKFGTGVVRTLSPEKIEVVFEDGVRMLVHNRA